MNQLYHSVHISKQAIHQYAGRQVAFDQRLERLMLEAEDLRKAHPGCGVEKMYYILKPDFIGRDRFVDIFMALGFRVQKKKNYKRTTIVSSIYYPNLIKGLKVSDPGVIWQSDITYIRILDKYYYAVFILDVLTKKIVGYQVSDHMRASANVQALNMALQNNPAPEIHHSDRGSQYTYKEYLAILQKYGSKISMGLTAQDNAYAERINRTIKEEYLNYWKPKDFNQLKKYVSKAVNNYNLVRPHQSLDYQTPIEFEKDLTCSTKKKTITIFNKELIT
jgi:hypothetical protein